MSLFSRNSFGRFAVANLALILIAWVLYIATPIDIIASNLDEFYTVSTSALLPIFLSFSLAIFIVGNILLLGLMVVIGILRLDIILRIVISCIIAISISVWLNSTFLVGAYGEFDGRGNLQIDPFSWLGWLQLFIFLFLCLLVFCNYQKIKAICYLVGLILIISLITTSVNFSKLLLAEDYASENPQNHEAKFFQYSAAKPNIVMLILDSYRTDFFKEILTPQLKQELDGFIWYPNNLANFPRTFSAMPAIFAAEIYDETENIESINSRIAEQELSFTHLLANNSYDVSRFGVLVAKTNFLFPKNTPFSSFLDDESTNFNIAQKLFIYSTFRATPDILKKNIYNDGKWLQFDGSHITLPIRFIYSLLLKVGSGEQLVFFSLAQFQDNGESYAAMKKFAEPNYVADNGLPSQFKFIHSLLTHRPVGVDEKCNLLVVPGVSNFHMTRAGKCVFKKFTQYLTNLKELGVYDNTMIIVMADHGELDRQVVSNNLFGQSEVEPKNKELIDARAHASAFLMIKPFATRGELKESDLPSQPSDMPRTISESLGLVHSYAGINLLNNDIKISDERPRYFNNHVWTSEYWALNNGIPPLKTYLIKGDMNDLNSWQELP